MRVGKLQQVHRYPVKSFAGERLNEVQVEPYGLYGDRSHAIVDGSKEGWDRFVTARDIPEMLLYRASLEMGEGGMEFPSLLITAPDGTRLSWNEELLHRFQDRCRQPLSLETHTREESQLAIDSGSVLLVTDASMRKLERQWGKRLDAGRFRPNLIVAMDEDRPFAEMEWTGRMLRIGTAVFQVDIACERCMMVTLDPATTERDPTLLKLLHAETALTFGMYAEVATPGMIRVGDDVDLL